MIEFINIIQEALKVLPERPYENLKILKVLVDKRVTIRGGS